MFTDPDHESSDKFTCEGAFKYKPATGLPPPALQLVITTDWPGQTVASWPRHNWSWALVVKEKTVSTRKNKVWVLVKKVLVI